MTRRDVPIVLGVDPDEAGQAVVATAFQDAGVPYERISDRKRVGEALLKVAPDLIILFADVSSDFAIHVLDQLAKDIAWAARPVVMIASDTGDAPFVAGLRTGVVALLPAPFTPAHIDELQRVWRELPGRGGVVHGAGDPQRLSRLVEHLRRTRRSGVLLTDPHTPSEGRATFMLGRLERARFLGAGAHDALRAMVSQAKTEWSFSELAGSHGAGAAVVIEVGDVAVGETELAGVVVEDGAAAAPVPAAPAPAAPQPAPAPRPKLLLVDDDETILKMFSRLFTKHGFDVSTATDGERGLEVASRGEFDVVLADLNMPRLDGWGMLRALRDDFRTRELPVAFASAHDDYHEALRALDAGAQAYLSKGVKLDALVTQARKLLEPRAIVAQALAAGDPFAVSIHAVGPQWFLRQVAQQRLGGTLIARDGWASYQLDFVGGACVQASASAGRFTAESERAFTAFVASKQAEGDFMPGLPLAAGHNLEGPLEELLARAVSTLNDNERRLREGLMLSATRLEVNGDLYALYQQIAPKASLETARLICEEGLPPREVIAHVEASPLEVEETVKDLIRRGVVTLART
jgi:CheY-like chemotaxis protein